MPLSKPFEQLREGEFFAVGHRVVTDGDIRAFAELTGDSHPQHMDNRWAASMGMFGERTAHGMLVLSYAVGMMTAEPDQMLAIRRISDVVFTRPVRIGDAVRLEGRVTSLTAPSAAVGVVGMSTRIVNQEDRTACRARFEVLWRRHEASAQTGWKGSREGVHQ